MQASLFDDVFTPAAPPPPAQPAPAPVTDAGGKLPHSIIFTPGCRLRIHAPHAGRPSVPAVSLGPAAGQPDTAVSVEYTIDGTTYRTVLFVGTYCITAVEINGEWVDFEKRFGDIRPRCFVRKEHT